MRSSRVAFATLTAALLLGGCSSSATSTASPTPATQSPAAKSSPSSKASTHVALDPCLLVTSAEASSLTGVTYAGGTEDTTTSGGKICFYGSQTINLVEVFLAQAPDAATANSEWAQKEAEAQTQLSKAAPPGVTVNITINDVSNISGADRAALGMLSETFNGHTLNGIGIYILKGAVFVSFVAVVLDHAAPSSSAMEAEASVILKRI